jgi:hypothetical protein
MAQSSTVFEFRAADPAASSSRLFSRAMSVGRDHVAATINTLFLAYAGASLPLLILFSSSPDPLTDIVSSEIVAIEIVRTLVGSIGLMASVPLTTMLAAWLAKTRAPEAVDHRGERPDAQQHLSKSDETVDAFADLKPFSTDDNAESEWERRLRDSYGLDRLHTARRRPLD